VIRSKSIINGRYRVERKIGEGGMAIVYQGHDLLLARDVAIKTPLPQFTNDPAFRARFQREARASASLSHPNIIDVFDVGEEKGQPYIVMELVGGQTLKEIIAAEAPFHPADVGELLRQVGGALDYAHRRGYVHRDIKPGNILVDEHRRARVVDFGIARGLADVTLTDPGGLGTANYVSPEQASGLMATPASDIYSAGIVAFEMLTGEVPFNGTSPLAVAMQQLHDPPPPPSSLQPSLSAATDAVILRALDKDPTRRWPTVTALAEALSGSGRVDRTALGGSTPPNVWPAVKSTSAAPTFVIITLVLVAFATLLWFGFRNLVPAGDPQSPTVIAPIQPVITGAIEEVPTQTPVPSPTPQPTAEPTIAPTTAPATAPTMTAVPEPPPIVAADVQPTMAPITQVQQVTVPDLRGQPIGAVTSSLIPLGLRFDMDGMEPSDTVPMNSIISQRPAPGTQVPPGTTVEVTVSRGPSPFGNNSP
jgi:serine/threonine-protein kinase